MYFVLQCAIYAQDFHKIVLFSPMRNIVLLSPMRNICTRFVQDCTYFLNAQYMCKICARFAQDCTSFSSAQYARNCTYFLNVQYMCKICTRLMYFILQCAIYAQDLHKIVLISPLCNICPRLYLFLQCAIFAQDCKHYWEKYVTHHISALNLEWYSLLLFLDCHKL